MPYRRRGRVVYVKKAGAWRKKATAKSKAAADRMIRLLRGVKHGMKPRREKK